MTTCKRCHEDSMNDIDIHIHIYMIGTTWYPK